MHIIQIAARVLVFPLMLAVIVAGSAGAAEVEMQFYGNQHFRLKSPDGKVILINPWITGNKDVPFGIDHYKKGEVDLILVTAVHGDDMGQVVDIAANTGATVFAPAELGGWMAGKIAELGGSKSQVYGGAISGR